MGVWRVTGRVTGSIWLQDLTVRSIRIFNSTPSGNKPVGIHDRMGMEFASEFIGALVVKSQLFKLVRVFIIISPTNTQEDVHVPLVHTQLMELSNAGGCVGPVWGAAPVAIASGQLDVYHEVTTSAMRFTGCASTTRQVLFHRNTVSLDLFEKLRGK
eukprot:1153362-Pelagomonas_calceolata.AAC.3